MKRRVLIAAAAALLAVPAAFLATAGPAGDTLTVVKKDAVLRQAPRFYAAAAASLAEGERVERLATQQAWHQVRVLRTGQTGFLHDSAVSRAGAAALSTSSAGAVSESDRTLAAKGFNEEIERGYRAQHANLAPAFSEVDAIERNRVPPEALEKFLKEGRLGDFR